MSSDKQNLWIEEEYVEVASDEKRYNLGSSEPYETRFTTPGEAYKALMREHGRCAGKVYIGDHKPIGWVFVKRRQYDDDNTKTYLQEVWVTLHNGPPKRTITYDYHYL